MKSLTMQHDTISNTWSYQEQNQMQTEVILASQSVISQAPPIVTLRCRVPRIIWAEIMTHRMFSRNARSSRAVPAKTMINEVINMPFIPWHMHKNQPGMQGTVPLSVDEEARARFAWIKASESAVRSVEFMTEPHMLNIHKQIPNRLLEPFAWIDGLITSTNWSNFLWLRDHEAAEPHLRDFAELVCKALETMQIKTLELDEWHLPYISPMDIQDVLIRPDSHTERMIDETGSSGYEIMNMLSAARCARISYKPFNGDASYAAEIARYDSLVSSDRIHASPMEHQAKADTLDFLQIAIGDDETSEAHSFDFKWSWANQELHGNLEGYIQARKLIEGEFHP